MGIQQTNGRQEIQIIHHARIIFCSIEIFLRDCTQKKKNSYVKMGIKM